MTRGGEGGGGGGLRLEQSLPSPCLKIDLCSASVIQSQFSSGLLFGLGSKQALLQVIGFVHAQAS